MIIKLSYHLFRNTSTKIVDDESGGACKIFLVDIWVRLNHEYSSTIWVMLKSDLKKLTKNSLGAPRVLQPCIPSKKKQSMSRFRSWSPLGCHAEVSRRKSCVFITAAHSNPSEAEQSTTKRVHNPKTPNTSVTASMKINHGFFGIY